MFRFFDQQRQLNRGPRLRDCKAFTATLTVSLLFTVNSRTVTKNILSPKTVTENWSQRQQMSSLERALTFITTVKGFLMLLHGQMISLCRWWVSQLFKQQKLS